MSDMNEPAAQIVNDELTEKVIGCAIKLHRVLGPGFLETIYHQAFAHELGKAGIPFVNEARMQVKYDGIVLGDYIADFLIDHRVVIEIKAIDALLKAHEVQLVNYLNAIQYDVGLLINFGGDKVQVKRKYRERHPSKESGLSLLVPHVPPV